MPGVGRRVVAGAGGVAADKGTEAAAATAAMMEVSLSIPSVFRADHPFLFLIRDRRTGSLLFLGRVADPRQA